MRRIQRLIICALLSACSTEEQQGLQLAPANSEQPSLSMSPNGVSVIRLIDQVGNAKFNISGGQAIHLQQQQEWPLTNWKQLRSTPTPLWTHPLPIRLEQQTFIQQPDELQLHKGDQPVRYQTGFHAGRKGKGATVKMGRWEITRNQLILVSDSDPNEANVRLIQQGANDHESRMDFDAAGLNEAEFVTYRVEHDLLTRSSLLLPAPSNASFSVDIPSDARFRFGYGIAPSEEKGILAHSGFEVLINGNQVWSDTASTKEEWKEASLDLSAYGNQTIELTLQTNVQESSKQAYSAFAEPEIVENDPNAEPSRIIVIGLDTLRRDHLGTHGYPRSVSTGLDQIATQSIVFEEAWTPAPRTRPSFRSSTTGRWPLDAIQAPTLGEVFAQQGFTTAGFVANVQLAPRLGFADGYGSWSYDNMADGDLQVNRVLSWLEQHKQEDVKIFLHMMDPHIFYLAPKPFRDRFTNALDRGDLNDKYNRWDITRANKAGALSGEQKRWITGRYDGEISFMDHELLRLIDAVDKLPGRTMFVFHNDHGEEFWEHGGFEHNHSLYNELVQAILWIRPPGGWANGPHRIEEPVSLVDIAPTVFSAAAIPREDWPTVDGFDLTPFVDVTKRDEQESLSAELLARPLPLGHLMFGRERWGVVAKDHKYILHTSSGEQELYDLKADPSESNNLAETADTVPWQAELAKATKWPIASGWRMQFTGLRHETVISFKSPIGRAFVVDPEANRLKRANLEWGERPKILPDDVAIIQVSEDRTQVTLTPGDHASGIVFIEGPTETTWAGAKCTLGNSSLWGNKKSSICSRRVELSVGPMLIPETNEEARLRDSPEDNTIEALQSLGYIE